MSSATCQAVSASCPVSATTYGYVPNLSANAFLCALFSLAALIQIGASTYHKAWSFLVALGAGAALEAVGYGGRLMMYDNVWNQDAFKIQIIGLVIAPSFIAAGVYLSLKHIIIYLAPEISRIKPRLYTWIFIGCDIFSIMLQAAGGGVAAAATSANPALLSTGNNIIIAGIAFQVVTMSVCGCLAADYFIRYSKAKRNGLITSSGDKGYHNGPVINHQKFKIFVGVEIFAYLTVLIRCIYRIPEMAGGWGNPLMQNEKEFLLLDGMMIAFAVVAFTIFHPGWFFPPMTGRWQKQRIARDQGSDSLRSDSEK